MPSTERQRTVRIDMPNLNIISVDTNVKIPPGQRPVSARCRPKSTPRSAPNRSSLASARFETGEEESSRARTVHVITPRLESTGTAFCTCQESTANSTPRRPALGTPRSAPPSLSRNQASWMGCDSSNPAYHALLNHWNLFGLHWIYCTNGQMPSRAVQGGHLRSGEPLYVARALTPAMQLCIGTFRPATGRCHMMWRNREITSDQYEILCYRSRLQSRTGVVSRSFSHWDARRPLLNDSLKVQTLKSPLKVVNFKLRTPVPQT